MIEDPRPLRLLPRGGRWPAGRDVRAGAARRGQLDGAARATARSPCCRPTGTGWRRSSRSRCSASRRSRTSGIRTLLLRAGELHRRPAPDARRVARGRRPLRRLRPELASASCSAAASATVMAQWLDRVEHRRSTSPRSRVDRAHPFEATRRFREERTCRAARLPASTTWPGRTPSHDRPRRPPLAVPRPARRRRRALRRHQRLGVPRLCSPGRASPRPSSGATSGRRGRSSAPARSTSRSARRVGVIDMSLMSHFTCRRARTR